MNHRQRVFSALKGEKTDTVPFIPRLDIWYNANKFNGTLPAGFKNASLRDITDELDLGYHSVIPLFRDMANEDDGVDIGLGIYRFRTIPYWVDLHGIKWKVTRNSEGLTRVEYLTPVGKITTGVVYDESMKKSGATLAYTKEHAVKGLEDFEAIAYIFENAEVRPNYSYYREYKESVVGDRGVAVGYSSVCACPMHYLLKELMTMDVFFYELYVHPEEMERLAGRLAPFCKKIFGIAADSPAEVILSGANYDTAVTPPPFFEQYIAPELKRQSEVLHTKGKYLLTHTDGENAGLLEHYLNSGIDIADSICPAPMTSQSLKEIKDQFAGKVTIWGGIPSISVLENSMSDYEFEKYLDMTLEGIGKGDHIIFSIADTTPPDAKFSRILRIAEKVKEFGPVKL